MTWSVHTVLKHGPVYKIHTYNFDININSINHQLKITKTTAARVGHIFNYKNKNTFI